MILMKLQIVLLNGFFFLKKKILEFFQKKLNIKSQLRMSSSKLIFIEKVLEKKKNDSCKKYIDEKEYI
jgi:hypothetical protein